MPPRCRRFGRHSRLQREHEGLINEIRHRISEGNARRGVSFRVIVACRAARRQREKHFGSRYAASIMLLVRRLARAS